MRLIDSTLSNARQFYSSMGNPTGVKGLIIIIVVFDTLSAILSDLTVMQEIHAKNRSLQLYYNKTVVLSIFLPFIPSSRLSPIKALHHHLHLNALSQCDFLFSVKLVKVEGEGEDEGGPLKEAYAHHNFCAFNDVATSN